MPESSLEECWSIFLKDLHDLALTLPRPQRYSTVLIAMNAKRVARAAVTDVMESEGGAESAGPTDGHAHLLKRIDQLANHMFAEPNQWHSHTDYRS